MAFEYLTVSLVSGAASPDKYGDVTEVWSVIPIDSCLFAPSSSVERTDPRVPAVIADAVLYLPAGAPIPQDRDLIALPPGAHLDSAGAVVYDGPAYAVVGEPGLWGDAGIEVTVKRWKQP